MTEIHVELDKEKFLSTLADVINDHRVLGSKEFTLNVGGVKLHSGDVYDAAPDLLSALKAVQFFLSCRRAPPSLGEKVPRAMEIEILVDKAIQKAKPHQKQLGEQSRKRIGK